MLFGAHAFIWAGEWTPKGAQKAIGGAAEAGLEAPVPCGVLYAHLGTLTGRPPEEEELEDVARVLKNVAR